ncbi:hypothetical protein, partial [Enterobacter hormaechei]
FFVFLVFFFFFIFLVLFRNKFCILFLISAENVNVCFCGCFLGGFFFWIGFFQGKLVRFFFRILAGGVGGGGGVRPPGRT